MQTRLLTIEYEIPGRSDDHHLYASDQSLLDADVIVFKPENLAYGDDGKPSFSESYSFKLERSTEHWRKELSTALDYGKTVFLILEKRQVASIHTGRTEIKGRTTINYVRDYCNYDFLPIELPAMITKSGSEILSKGDPVFAIFWKEFGEFLRYVCYLNESVQRPIFITKTGERPVGAVYTVDKGHLVLMPLIDYNRKSFIKTRNDGDSYWTKEAISFGDKLVTTLLDIDKCLRSESMATPPPTWTANSEFKSTRETEILEKITDTKKQIEQLKARTESLRVDLLKEQQLRDLLFETGKRLEAAVTNALKTLGYFAENHHDGDLELDQVIISPEGERFVGECEGKDNAAVNIDKLRQLTENIQADLQRESVTEPAIGILFGNGFRLSIPKDRQEQFTEKCRSSAKRGTILVRTADLYPIVRYIRESNDQDYARACRDAILASAGRIVNFPTLPIR
jgi:hypothetical protein